MDLTSTTIDVYSALNGNSFAVNMSQRHSYLPSIIPFSMIITNISSWVFFADMKHTMSLHIAEGSGMSNIGLDYPEADNLPL